MPAKGSLLGDSIRSSEKSSFKIACSPTVTGSEEVMEPTIPNKITTERKSITALPTTKASRPAKNIFKNFIPIYLIFIRCETAHEARTGRNFSASPNPGPSESELICGKYNR